MRGIPYLFAVAVLSLGRADVRADVIQVPGEHADIQLGIDAASDGDTVLVGPGTYYENINFRGKNIVVASHFILAGDRSYVNTTAINGSVSPDLDSASCVTVCSGEDSSAALAGFTITGGQGTNWVDPQNPEYTWRGGGGVFVFQSSPTVRHNLIVENTVAMVAGVDGAQGGGVLTYGGNPRLLNNMIADNRAEYGCGVVVDYSGAVIRNNVICRNTGGGAYGGGGFWAIGNGADPIVLENNTIAENAVSGSGAYGGRGGGMFVWYGEVTGRNNIIWGNTQSQGGQIAQVSGGTAVITYSAVEGGFTGEGNIDEDPLLAPPKYVLSGGSPCIDTGDPAPACNDPEDPANPGYAHWPAQGELRNDMGTYGGPGSAILAAGSTTSEGPVGQASPVRRAITRCRPNPFREGTTIEYSLPRMGWAALVVHNTAGRSIGTLFQGVQTSGLHRAHWRPNSLPPGLYACRLALDGISVGTTTLVLTR
jgi:hypothetical protein